MIQGIQNVSFNGGKSEYVNKLGAAVKEAAQDSYAATRRNINMAKIKNEIEASNAEYMNKVIYGAPKSAEKAVKAPEAAKFDMTSYSAGPSFEDRANSYALSHGAVGLKINTNA